MLKSTLIQGLATNLPFAFLYASHTAAIDTILKYGTKKQIDIVSIDAVREVEKVRFIYFMGHIFFSQLATVDSRRLLVREMTCFIRRMEKFLALARSGSLHLEESQICS